MKVTAVTGYSDIYTRCAYARMPARVGPILGEKPVTGRGLNE